MLGRITVSAVLVVAIIGMTVLVSNTLFVSKSVTALAVTPQTTAVLPSLTTDTWGIFEPTTGNVLVGNNIDHTRPIASVTKLFTAYATLQSNSLHATTTITRGDLAAEGEAGKLSYGERTTPYELLFPLLIESSNDAGVAIRRVIGPDLDSATERIIRDLELRNTHIIEPTGLNDANVSTVHDLARLLSCLRKDAPRLVDITTLTMYISESTGLINNDPARAFKNFTGGKHGYTEAAGRTFVGTFRLPNTNNEVGIVLLGSTNLHDDIGALLSYAAEYGL